MTFRLTGGYGSQRSMITGCGLVGKGGSLSMITFRGGGGNFLPGSRKNIKKNYKFFYVDFCFCTSLISDKRIKV